MNFFPYVLKFGEVQIRCKDAKLCTKSGTKVIVTDLNERNETDLVLSSRAFRAMANNGMDKELMKLGIADVDYRRSVVLLTVRESDTKYLTIKTLSKVCHVFLFVCLLGTECLVITRRRTWLCGLMNQARSRVT